MIYSDNFVHNIDSTLLTKLVHNMNLTCEFIKLLVYIRKV